MHRLLLIAAVVAATAFSATAQIITVNLAPVQDNTLYESLAGNLSNGGGSFLFAGETGPGGSPATRRALVQFDIAGNVPAGSMIIGATLSATIDNPNGGLGNTTLTLHPVIGDWGEGTTVGTSGEGGGGPAGPGDATWKHRHFPDVPWSSAGGDFGLASASVVGGANGPLSWPNTAATIGDVQAWLDDPCHNAGWLVDGNGGPAKRLGSRENPTAANRPSLEVVYLAGPPPAAKFVGNTNDLVIDVLLNGCPSGNGSGVHDVLTALGDVVTLNFNSPMNTYTGQGFFACLQPFVTGMTTADPGGPLPLPLGGGTLVHLDLANGGSIFVLTNSLGGGLVTEVISPFGDVNFVVPPAFAGLSLVTSCLITDFSIPGDFIAVASAQELRLL